MINFRSSDEVIQIVGSPGTGKTYIAASMAIFHIRQDKKNFVCSNVPFLPHDQIIQLPDVPSLSHFSSAIRPNTLFIIDEITRIWGDNSLKKSSAAWDDFVAMIRHRSCRIVVITQHMSQVPEVFKSRISSIYSLKSVRDVTFPWFGFNYYDLEILLYNLFKKRVRFFIYEISQRSISGHYKVLSKSVDSFSSEVFTFYNSVSYSTGWKEPYVGRIKGLKNFIARFPVKFFLTLFIFVIFVWLFIFGGIFDVVKFTFTGVLKNDSKIQNTSPPVEKGFSESLQNSLPPGDISSPEAPHIIYFSPDSFAAACPDPGISSGLPDFEKLSLIGIINGLQYISFNDQFITFSDGDIWNGLQISIKSFSVDFSSLDSSFSFSLSLASDVQKL